VPLPTTWTGSSSVSGAVVASVVSTLTIVPSRFLTVIVLPSMAVIVPKTSCSPTAN
jgi:hypothetical protein